MFDTYDFDHHSAVSLFDDKKSCFYEYYRNDGKDQKNEYFLFSASHGISVHWVL